MQPNIKNSAMINGLIIGLLLSFKFLLSIPKNYYFGLLGFLISISIIYLLYIMTVKLRDEEFDGVLRERRERGRHLGGRKKKR